MRTLLTAIKGLEHHNWQLHLGIFELAAARPIALPAVTAGCHYTAQPFHSSASCRDDSDAAEQEDENQQQQQAASSTARGGSRAPHISLDDPELNIYLRYNTEFRTDMHRAYAIGHRQAFEKATRLELRKALAAHRLELRDYAAASSAKQPPLHEQMLQRLSQMQDYAAGITR